MFFLVFHLSNLIQFFLHLPTILLDHRILSFLFERHELLHLRRRPSFGRWDQRSRERRTSLWKRNVEKAHVQRTSNRHGTSHGRRAGPSARSPDLSGWTAFACTTGFLSSRFVRHPSSRARVVVRQVSFGVSGPVNTVLFPLLRLGDGRQILGGCVHVVFCDAVGGMSDR